MSDANRNDGPGSALYLEAQQLAVGYEGQAVVEGIEIELARGQSLALMGMNGSGKSTLLKTIAGLLPPVSGRIRVLGKEPGSTPRRIAYLSQFHPSGFILPLKAADIVRMGRYPARGLFGRMTREDDELVTSAMRRMGVEHLAEDSLRLLSGGQQQRVYLAQVLAYRADLLVLDEPTAGLDAAGQEIYLQALREETARGAAIVTATHDIQEAAKCDQVQLLARRVVAAGPARQVLTPANLLETFGIVVTLTDEHFGLTVLEREHGHQDAESRHG